MPKNKNRRPQSPKSRSIETRDFLLMHRGSRIPSATQYKRKPKHVSRGYDE